MRQRATFVDTAAEDPDVASLTRNKQDDSAFVRYLVRCHGAL